MISGLLYQEYRDKSTLQEIETRRQQDAEIQGNADRSPASEEAPEEDEEEEEEELPSPPERKALPQICLLSNPHSRFNLWQDLPEIRSSGVLDILQPEEIRLQEVTGGPRGGGFRSECAGVSTSVGEASSVRRGWLTGRMTGGVHPSRTCGKIHLLSQATENTSLASRRAQPPCCVFSALRSYQICTIAFSQPLVIIVGCFRGTCER